MIDGRTSPLYGSRRQRSRPSSPRHAQHGPRGGAGEPIEPMEGALVGNYRILGKLGEGGMGAVYLAEHTIIERKVALKVLLPELSHDPESLGRFFNEAKAAARLQHPGLISVHDFGHLASGSAYLVMEYLEGETLAARIWREKSLELPHVIEIARQLAGALGAAHEQGIIHRDLKPENIFLVPSPDTPEGVRVKVLDFGIAKLVREDGPGSFKTSTGIILGTPMYMSPEQCRGITLLDHRADIYALGCILYEMVSGQPPFDGEGPGDVLAAHIHLKPRPLHQLAPSVPLPLERIILKAMAKQPKARHQRMAELLEDLDIWAQVQRVPGVGTDAASGVSIAAAPPISTPTVPMVSMVSIDPSDDGLIEDLSSENPRDDDTPLWVEMPRLGTVRSMPPWRRSLGAWPRGAWQARGTRTFAMSLGAAVLLGTIALAIWRSGRPATTSPHKAASPAPASPEAAATPAEKHLSLVAASASVPPTEGPSSRLRIESQPSGAAVLRVTDGTMLGNTPLELSASEIGGSALLLHLAGHRDGWVEPAFDESGHSGHSGSLRVVLESLPDRRAPGGRKRASTLGPASRHIGDGALDPFGHGRPAHGVPRPASPAHGLPEHWRADGRAKPHR